MFEAIADPPSHANECPPATISRIVGHLREGIISSDPEIGSVKHGLTQNGRTQARVAATALIEVVRKGLEGGVAGNLRLRAAR